MAGAVFFPFHPEKLLRHGCMVLGVGTLVAMGTLLVLMHAPSLAETFQGTKQRVAEERAPLSFSLDVGTPSLPLPMPRIEGEIAFSFDPPRPEADALPMPVVVRLSKSRQSRRVALLSRVPLSYGKGLLSFAEEESPFWIEVLGLHDGEVEGRVCVEGVGTRSFSCALQESPLRGAQELEEGSPFRTLAEARWWGNDLCREKAGMGMGGERLEVGPLAHAELLEIEGGDWLIWKEGRWKKGSSLEEGKGLPVARIAKKEGRSLILEGWDVGGHFRCAVAPFNASPLRGKVEELFSSIRVRSEKQMSCMMEKQCLILKVGDWVVKSGNRWKILRKKEDQESFLQGKRFGELFVFERIETKGGGKVVQGSLYNAARSQVVAVEVPAGASKKNSPLRETGSKRGRK